MAMRTELIGPALPGRGEGVAAVHVEGRGEESEARDVAGGALDVDLGVDLSVLHLARVTLQVPILETELRKEFEFNNLYQPGSLCHALSLRHREDSW